MHLTYLNTQLFDATVNKVHLNLNKLHVSLTTVSKVHFAPVIIKQ